MNVGIVGAGYVGLVQAVGLAVLGARVRLAEKNPEKLASLSEGRVPIFEAGLEDAMSDAIEKGNLTFHSDNIDVAQNSEVVFLCLPTPPSIDGVADLSFLNGVLAELAEANIKTTIVIKSTVPVGTTERMARRYQGVFPVLHNPEFLREGTALDDFLHPDRVVIGGGTQEERDMVASVYEGLDTETIFTDATSAELIKYASNSYLATRITFVNALANIAESVGADILDVTRGMGADKRIGRHFLKPGPGYGGSCFPKDTVALLATSRQAGYEFALLNSVVDVDRSQRHWVTGNIRRLVGGDLDGAKIGMWGVAFKSGTDDTRESPALKIALVLQAEGAKVTAYDPEANDPSLSQVDSPIEAARGARLLLVATEWPEFNDVDMGAVAEVMEGDIVYDVRNLLNPEKVRAAGLRYVGLGRPKI